MPERLEEKIPACEKKGTLLQLENDYVFRQQRAHEQKFRNHFQNHPMIGTLNYMGLTAISIAAAKNHYQSKEYWKSAGCGFIAVVSLAFLYQYTKAWFYSYERE